MTPLMQRWFAFLHRWMPLLPSDLIEIVHSYYAVPQKNQIVFALACCSEICLYVPWQFVKRHEPDVISIVIRVSANQREVYIHDMRNRLFATESFATVLNRLHPRSENDARSIFDYCFRIDTSRITKNSWKEYLFYDAFEEALAEALNKLYVAP